MQLRAGVGICAVVLFGSFYFAVIGESRAGSEDQLVTAIDGDTIQLNGKVVQLYGIDAPELGQQCLNGDNWFTCGLAAAHQLDKRLSLSIEEVKCVSAEAPGTSDKVCLAGKVDIAQALLTAGYVTANARTDPYYHELEKQAREAGLGLWQSEFVTPSQWRQGRRLPGEPTLKGDDCPIKAIALGNNQGLYIVPTDDGYGSVTLDPVNGDRRYCSDESARQDGWRRAGELAK